MKKLIVFLSIFAIAVSFSVTPKVEAAAKFNYDYTIVDQSAYPSNVEPGQLINVWIEVKNTGNATWYRDGDRKVRLGTGSIYGAANQQRDYASEFANTDWLSPNRPVSTSEDSIVPGLNTRFQFNIKAPETPGTYKAYFTPVVDGWTWMYDRGIYWEITVNGSVQPGTCTPEGGSLGATVPDNNNFCCAGLTPFIPEGLVGTMGTCQKSGYQDPARSKKLSEYMFEYVGQSANPTITRGVGKGALVTIKLKNIGTSTWFSSGSYALRLGTSHPQDRISVFKPANDMAPVCVMQPSSTDCAGFNTVPGWVSGNRVEMDQQYNVKPGETGNFNIYFEAANNLSAGKYKEYLQPVVDGLGWLTDIGIYAEITVVADAVQQPVVQQPAANATVTSLTLSPNIVSVKTGTVYDFVLIANYSDGSTKTVTDAATWDVIYGTGTGTMHRDIPGRFIAGGLGYCNITASFGGKSVTSGVITVLGM